MKVLIIHNCYKILGGEDISTQAEIDLLRLNGINVDTYYLSNSLISNSNTLWVALNAIWSRFQYKNIQNKIKEENYDIVHVQNFFPLFSPSIFYALKKSKTKVIMSVRNYRLICPNAMLFVRGSICNKCVGSKIPLAGIITKCYRKSYSASAAVVAMLSLHNFMKTWSYKIDAFICVSDFVRKQMIIGGLPTAKLFVKHNFVSTDVPPNFKSGDYYIYSGRLSDEKGIDILLETFCDSNRKLVIAGEGPLQHIIESAGRKNRNISFVGKQSLTENYKLISKAKALIYPSRWHEPFGRTIVEAFAHGTPVIASSLGGIKELVEPYQNGLLFNPFQKEDLVRKLSEFEEIKDLYFLRQQCYKKYTQHFLPSTNFEQMIRIYKNVIASANG